MLPRKPRQWSVANIFVQCLLASAVLLVMSPQTRAADLLVIDEIKVIKPAGGLDAAGLAGFFALGAVIGSSIAVQANPAIATLSAVKIAATSGGAALKAAEFLDGSFSGTDQLLVTVGGTRVPLGPFGYAELEQGDSVGPFGYSFEGGIRVQLTEYDQGSDNDDLGSLDINGDYYDRQQPGQNYGLTDSLVLAPAEEDGSVYQIAWRVIRGAGNPDSVTRNLICGTNACNGCSNADCIGQRISDLDRDGDKEDLLACPYPMETIGYQTYEQIFPFEDVYLRVCGRACPASRPVPVLSYTLSVPGKPGLRWAETNADKYEIWGDFERGSFYKDIPRFTPPTTLQPGSYRYFVRGVYLGAKNCSSEWGEGLTVTIPEVPVPLSIDVESADVAGYGGGTVTAMPAPLSKIGGDLYTPGDVVYLEAVPDERSLFVEWRGAPGCSTSPGCNVTIVRGDGVNVSAVFRPKPTLRLFSVGRGSVSASPAGVSCSNVDYACFLYDEGQQVTLAAVSDTSSDLLRWAGDPGCETGSVTMNGDLTCRAVFKRNQYALTVTPSDGSTVTSTPAGISCGAACGQTFPVAGGATSVFMNATIEPGYTFVRWAGLRDCWDEDEGDGDPLRVRVTAGERDVNCSVVTVPSGTEYALTIEKRGGGSVAAEALPASDSSGIDCPLSACAQSYPVNTEVRLTAKASRGAEFAGFESTDVGSDDYRREDDDCIDGIVSMIDNVECTATFNTQVLIVNGSNDDVPRESNPFIGILNNQEAVDYDVWHIKSPNSGDNSTDPETGQRRVEPVAEDLANYGRVIWYTGDANAAAGGGSPMAGPSAAGEASLGTYLDQGGCLLMSSPEYFRDRGLTPFMRDYFGIDAINPDRVEAYIAGAGDPGLGFSELTRDSFLGTGSEGYFGITSNQNRSNFSDALVRRTDLEGSDAVFTYRTDPNSGAAGVALDAGAFRSVFLGFPVLGIPSGSRQNNTVGAFLDFCGQADVDSRFEVNDDFGSASDIYGPINISGLTILFADNDYFEWQSQWFADAQVSLSYDQAQGNLALEVYDSARTLVAASDENTGTEQVLLIDVDAGETYFLRVYGVAGAEGQYSLEVTQSGESDRDHDGLRDVDDPLPEDPDEQSDADGDLIGDKADTDDDNDGLPDMYEVANGFDPLVPNPLSADTDNDSFTDLQEFNAGTDPRSSASVPVVANLLSVFFENPDAVNANTGLPVWMIYILSEKSRSSR